MKCLEMSPDNQNNCHVQISSLWSQSSDQWQLCRYSLLQCCADPRFVPFQHPPSKLCHNWLLRVRGLVLCGFMPQDLLAPFLQILPELVAPLRARGLASCWSAPQALLSSTFKFFHNWLCHWRWQAWCHGYPHSKPCFPAPSDPAIIGYTTEGDWLGGMVIHTPSPAFQHLQILP